MAALQMICAFIVALGVLITFHELGHFLVARRCGVKVLQFSVGFGRPLWSRKFGPDNTEFVIGAFPLGGYVKMLDEREGFVAGTERARAFNNKSLGERVAIVAAGPVFNFIFAVLAYWIVYIIGITGLKPVVGSVQEGSPAVHAGFQVDDEITKINGRATPTWNSALELLVAGVIDHSTAAVRVKDAQGLERLLAVELSAIPIDSMAEGNLLNLLGVEPARPSIPAVIGAVTQQGAAWQAGLARGDRIAAVDGVAVRDWQHWVEIVRAAPEVPLSVSISRAGEAMELTMTPEAKVSGQGSIIGFIGAGLDPGYEVDQSLFATESYPAHTALAKGAGKTLDMTVVTLQMLWRMVTGQASLKNLSGPVSIAQYAGQTAQLGIVAFLGFLAIVSISLAILNLLPVPLLDGGHLFYYFIEFLKGSPVSDATQMLGQRIGLVLLFSLMALAIFNDLVRITG
jgi:regulator of sigma E protease